MSIPIPNTTCDIFHNAGGPSGTPDVAGVPCVLIPDFVGGHTVTADTAGSAALRWTHILLVNSTIDLRDDYTAVKANAGQENVGSSEDCVYIPNKNGTQFVVIFVERVGRGTPGDQKRAFIQRTSITWPSSDI